MVSRFFPNEKEGLKKNIIICSTTVKFSGTHSKEKIINMFVAVYNMNRCQYLTRRLVSATIYVHLYVHIIQTHVHIRNTNTYDNVL